jgi:hypothetical protein
MRQHPAKQYMLEVSELVTSNGPYPIGQYKPQLNFKELNIHIQFLRHCAIRKDFTHGWRSYLKNCLILYKTSDHKYLALLIDEEKE